MSKGYKHQSDPARKHDSHGHAGQDPGRGGCRLSVVRRPAGVRELCPPIGQRRHIRRAKTRGWAWAAVGTRLARAAGVVSFPHELLVDLFRQRPALALELLRACVGIHLEGARVELGSIDLSQVAPVEYRTDAITVVRDLAGEPVTAVIVEVQLSNDEDKRRTWPVYVAVARASYRCPAILIVVAPSPAVARWARQQIELGHPGFALCPIVIGYDGIPRICDAAAARAAPELAVLSAMAHRDLETVVAADAGLAGLPKDKQKLYWDVIFSMLPASVRSALEARVLKGSEYQGDFARSCYSQGHQVGREKGREEGLRHAIVALVGARLPGIRDEVARRLHGIPEARLEQLLIETGTASDEDAVRAVLDRIT